MDFKSSLRGGLFIFECFRFTFLMGIMAALRAGAEANFPWLIYAVPNALFLIMTLFLWLNFNQYRVYTPLYISGKALSLFSVLGWFIFFREPGLAFPNTAGLNIIFIMLFFGDLLTIAFMLLIAKRTKIVDETEQGGQQ